jgi:hypothetical protein
VSRGTTVVLMTGVRHRIVMRLVDDLRIARTACEEWVATVGSKFDPKSAYQRAVYPLAERPTRCPACFA